MWTGRAPSDLAFGSKPAFIIVSIASLLLVTGCPGGTNLRGPGPKVNQRLRTETVMMMENGQVEIDSVPGQTYRGRTYRPPGAPEPVLGTFSMHNASTHDVTVVAVDGRQVSELRLTVVADDSRHSMSIDGHEERESARGSLVGRTIHQRREAGGTASTLEGDTPTPEQQKALDELDPIESDDEQYPSRSVKPGYAWTVTDRAVLQRILGGQMRVATGSMAMSFEQFVSFQVQPCALVKTSLNVSGSMPGDDGTDTGFTLVLEGSSHRSLESGYDLSTTLSGTLTLSRKDLVDGTPVKVRITGPVTLEGTTSLL